MKTRTIRSEQEKLDLIMQCRSSGLSDAQWCKNNNLPASTMYTWIKKFRKNGYPNIDNICNRTNEIQPVIQDVVKINVIHDDEYDEDRQQNTPILVNDTESTRAALEIRTGNTVISVNNNIEPGLFKILLSELGGSL